MPGLTAIINVLTSMNDGTLYTATGVVKQYPSTIPFGGGGNTFVTRDSPYPITTDFKLLVSDGVLQPGIPLPFTSGDFSTLLVQFSITGTINGSGVTNMLIYDVWLTVTLNGATIAVYRPTTWTMTQNFGSGDPAEGVIVNPANCFDGSLISAATLTRIDYGPLKPTGLFSVFNFQTPAPPCGPLNYAY